MIYLFDETLELAEKGCFEPVQVDIDLPAR
jgi:hypothetical protein